MRIEPEDDILDAMMLYHYTTFSRKLFLFQTIDQGFVVVFCLYKLPVFLYSTIGQNSKMPASLKRTTIYIFAKISVQLHHMKIYIKCSQYFDSSQVAL